MITLYKFEELVRVIHMDLHSLPLKCQFRRVMDMAKVMGLQVGELDRPNDSECEYMSVDIRDSENNQMEFYEGYAGITWDL